VPATFATRDVLDFLKGRGIKNLQDIRPRGGDKNALPRSIKGYTVGRLASFPRLDRVELVIENEELVAEFQRRNIALAVRRELDAFRLRAAGDFLEQLALPDVDNGDPGRDLVIIIGRGSLTSCRSRRSARRSRHIKRQSTTVDGKPENSSQTGRRRLLSSGSKARL